MGARKAPLQEVGDRVAWVLSEAFCVILGQADMPGDLLPSDENALALHELFFELRHFGSKG